MKFIEKQPFIDYCCTLLLTLYINVEFIL